MAKSFSEYKEVCSGLPYEMRLCVAAICACRALRVFEYLGDYNDYPQVVELVREARARIASGLSPCNDEQVAALVEELVEAYNDDGIGILACSTTVSLRLAQVIASESESSLSTARALASTVDVGIHVDRLLVRHGMPPTAKEGELAWVESLLKHAVSAENAAELCRTVGDSPPDWLRIHQRAHITRDDLVSRVQALRLSPGWAGTLVDIPKTPNNIGRVAAKVLCEPGSPFNRPL